MDESVEVAYGSLGKAREQKSERSPSHLGKLTFKQGVKPGQVIYLAAWIKTGDDGGKYYSIKATEPRSNFVPRAAATRGRPADDLDDEIPY
jgi:uncharacterized protein (DUF736 family)